MELFKAPCSIAKVKQRLAKIYENYENIFRNFNVAFYIFLNMNAQRNIKISSYYFFYVLMGFMLLLLKYDYCITFIFYSCFHQIYTFAFCFNNKMVHFWYLCHDIIKIFIFYRSSAYQKLQFELIRKKSDPSFFYFSTILF